MTQVAHSQHFDNQPAPAAFAENSASIGATLAGLRAGDEVPIRSPSEQAAFLAAIHEAAGTRPPELSTAAKVVRDESWRNVASAIAFATAHGQMRIVSALTGCDAQLAEAASLDEIEQAQRYSHRLQSISLNDVRARIRHATKRLVSTLRRSQVRPARAQRRILRRAVHSTRKTGDDGDDDGGESDPPKASPRFVAIASQQGASAQVGALVVSDATSFAMLGLTPRQFRAAIRKLGVQSSKVGRRTLARADALLAALGLAEPAKSAPEAEAAENPRERILRSISGGRGFGR